MERTSAYIFNLLNEQIGLPEKMAENLSTTIIVLLLIGACIVGYQITSRFVLEIVKRVVKRTKNTYDDVMLEKRVFDKLAQITPALIITHTIPSIIDSAPRLGQFLSNTSQTWIAVVIMMTLFAFLDALDDIYQKSKISKNRSIKGYIQLVKIILVIAVVFVIMAIYFENFDLYKVFAGLGTMAAVLILVFRDTILSLVASIQIIANDMVRLGDWIVMPKYNADGDVIEINLNTVKIQNWDKTISTVPVYALVSDSFQNWRGMSDSGGRRIKRSLNIDMKSVKFADEKLIDKLKKFHLLNDYITTKEQQLSTLNAQQNIGEDMIFNGSRQTNLGIFRKYLEAYLHMLPSIHDNMTFLVRHLQPSEKGIPMEIYVFSKEQEWSIYEDVQADIFDHILAIIGEFELRIFQNPTGDDLNKFINN